MPPPDNQSRNRPYPAPEECFLIFLQHPWHGLSQTLALHAYPPHTSIYKQLSGPALTHSHAYIYIHIQYNLSKSTDYGTDFKWLIYGGGRIREVEYMYGQSFGTELK